MKVNELMVDDYIYVKRGYDNHLTLERIKGILQDEKEAYPIKITTGEIIHLKDIVPIPLTPEILEKNGFQKVQIHSEKQDDIFQCFDGEIIIEVGIYDPNFILIHYRYETPDGINSGELSSIVKVDGGKFYLHELQHALRLCGIEKEIKL